MNSLALYALGSELDAALAGAAISAVLRYPAAATISFDGGPFAYLHILYPRSEPELFLSGEALAAPRHARREMSAAEGRTVKAVRPLGLDRMLVFELGALPHFGAGGAVLLKMDLASAARPLALYEDAGERLVASIGRRRGRKPAADRRRPQKSLSLFSLPASLPDGIGALQESETAAETAPAHTRRWQEARTLAASLVAEVAGIDPALARAIVREAGGEPKRSWNIVAEIGKRLAAGAWSWRGYRFSETSSLSIYPFELPLAERGERMASFAEALAARAREFVLPGYVEHLRRGSCRRARLDLKRLERLRENLSRDLADAERAGEYRHYGDLLATYRHMLRTGMSEIAVKDFSGDRSVTIPLDPARSPERNIRLYFAKAKKGERGALIIKDRARAALRGIEECRREIARIEELQSAADLIPLVPPEPSPAGRGDAPPRRFRRIPIDERHTVYVGRSDEENDILTHEFAAPTDLWFHAQDVPGSHVILRGAHRSTPGAVIEKAAAVAAVYSKAKHSGTVPVLYAEKRYVRRPRKSKPGAAICQRGKTIFVKPGMPDETDKD